MLTGVDRRVTSTNTGARAVRCMSASISSGIVAEKNRFWRLRRQRRENAANIGQEAHIEHPVGLVEHDDLDVAEACLLATEVVEQPTRGRDQQIDAASQAALLGLDTNATEDDGATQAQVRTIPLGHIPDLSGQLAGR